MRFVISVTSPSTEIGRIQASAVSAGPSPWRISSPVSLRIVDAGASNVAAIVTGSPHCVRTAASGNPVNGATLTFSVSIGVDNSAFPATYRKTIPEASASIGINKIPARSKAKARGRDIGIF